MWYNAFSSSLRQYVMKYKLEKQMSKPEKTDGFQSKNSAKSIWFALFSWILNFVIIIFMFPKKFLHFDVYLSAAESIISDVDRFAFHKISKFEYKRKKKTNTLRRQLLSVVFILFISYPCIRKSSSSTYRPSLAHALICELPARRLLSLSRRTANRM